MPITAMMVPVTTGEEGQEATDHRRHDDAEDAGDDHGTVDAQKADLGVGAHGDHGPDGGEGDAHHHRQADAEHADADALDQRDHAAGEEVGVDQECDLLLRQLQGPADDQRHGHGTGIHDEHVLQAQRQEAWPG